MYRRLREDKPLKVQYKNLVKKLNKLEKKYDEVGPAEKPRLLKEAESISKKLEALDILLA